MGRHADNAFFGTRLVNCFLPAQDSKKHLVAETLEDYHSNKKKKAVPELLRLRTALCSCFYDALADVVHLPGKLCLELAVKLTNRPSLRVADA